MYPLQMEVNIADVLVQYSRMVSDTIVYKYNTRIGIKMDLRLEASRNREMYSMTRELFDSMEMVLNMYNPRLPEEIPAAQEIHNEGELIPVAQEIHDEGIIVYPLAHPIP